MKNHFFQFKQFTIRQQRCAMKVTTDACLFGAWIPPSLLKGKFKALDIGTGTGLLSLLFAQRNAKAIIDAIEIDKDAFEQASENIALSPWADRITVFNGNAKEFQFPHQYDVIISNPPFYENELKSDNPKKNLARHNEGLLLPELLTIIKNNLKPGGSFYLLLPFKRKEEIIRILPEQELEISQMTFVRQSVKHDYFRIMLSGKLKTGSPVAATINEIAIADSVLSKSEQRYTPAFIQLLKDFYLYL